MAAASTTRPQHEGQLQSMAPPGCHVAVVIPCYRCKAQVLDVLARIGPEVASVFVVDDHCPEGTGAWVREQASDPRIRVLRHDVNQGVGAAVVTGYRAAWAAGATIIVKIDGDAQMDPALLPHFIKPIIEGRADYTKGNRFFTLKKLSRMPGLRLLGNALLSFMAKLSTGYWSVFDVTNGYTAVHASLLPYLELDKISRRYFFETDMLFRLGTLRAVVVDVPMDAVYEDETSQLRIGRILPEFAWKHLRNFAKRIGYTYFLRDMNLASLELITGVLLLGFGVVFGGWRWMQALESGMPTPLGTIMLAALPTLLGLQLLLAFMGHDIAQQPRQVLHPDLPDPNRSGPLT